MKKALIAAFAVAASQTVSAVPVLDTVIVGNQEWAQVNLFTDVSWYTIDSQCPGGVCSSASAINGYDLAGWTWASTQAIQSLFDTISGHPAVAAPTEYIQGYLPSAPLFTSLFTPTGINPTNQTETVYGWSYTGYDIRDAYAPSVTDHALSRMGRFTTEVHQRRALSDTFRGAWFVRDAAQEVPAPATLILFGLGLSSMWITRRKRGAKV